MEDLYNDKALEFSCRGVSCHKDEDVQLQLWWWNFTLWYSELWNRIVWWWIPKFRI